MENIHKVENEKKYSSHYGRYKDSIRVSQKKYYDRNADKLKEHVRDYYKNNTEYREKKIIQMRAYRARKKVEQQRARKKDIKVPTPGVV